MCMLGTDPELFVKAGSNLLPAYEFLPAKAEPLRDGNVRHFGMVSRPSTLPTGTPVCRGS